ncbi:hypothetical protein [Maricaulis virginensis]|uniref:Uncharacterized protein n=1 Tax=Maricaulis virginensis TaxID=144022 RepID=A0A9W6IJZ1_9PROT|nr:hypothetical protein [Maricaulis virginensis]GLK50510.1 hypothetical protein GCM10017621_00180 [Maricaulis virginensis]
MAKRKNTNDESKAATGKLQIVVLLLQILKIILDIRWIALLIFLIALPIAPYVLIPQADASASACTYLGPRGVWKPGWVTHCPAIALRPQYQMD